MKCKNSSLGPAVLIIVSLTKSLAEVSLVSIKSSMLIFLAEKMKGTFALQKFLTIFR